MTIYTFRPDGTRRLADWGDPTRWQGGVVPNSADADVDFPIVTYFGSNTRFTSLISIYSRDSFAVRSLAFRDSLTLEGTLRVSGQLNQSDNGYINLTGGTLSAGNYTIGGDSRLNGSGQVTAGNLTNNGFIYGQSAAGGAPLKIDATTFTNNGVLLAYSNMAVNIAPGGFTNYAAGTLTGGYYSAQSGATLALGYAPIVNNAAEIVLSNGGMITGVDPTTGQSVALTTSLHQIMPSGTLTIQSGSYRFLDLNVQGTVNVSLPGAGSSTSFSNAPIAAIGADRFTIAQGGVVQGLGLVTSPVVNDGTISASAGGTLILTGQVTGSGVLEVGAQTKFYPNQPDFSKATLEIAAPTTQGVRFATDLGTLRLDQPATFGGTITPTGTGNRIILQAVSYSSITGYNYAGDTSHGTLTIQQASGSTSLNFAGNLTTSNFTLSAGTAPVLSSDPFTTVISIANATPGPVCYLAGTLVLTRRGEVAIEELRAGDVLAAFFGGHRTVRWIGRQSFDAGMLRGIVREDGLSDMPVRIRAGALAPGVPKRDLSVSPDHSLLLAGMLFVARDLVNGSSIVQDMHPSRIDYYHVDLGAHDCIVADGAWAESYAEQHNRAQFHNLDDYRRKFEAHDAAFVPMCAEQVRRGDRRFDAVARGIAMRAAALKAAWPDRRRAA